MTEQVAIGIAGVGKIARDQHLPAIAGNSGYKLIAGASRNARIDGVNNYQNVEDDAGGGTVYCKRCRCARRRKSVFRRRRAALEAGKHVMLEKPPGASVTEVGVLAGLARQNKCSLFASWHSRSCAWR